MPERINTQEMETLIAVIITVALILFFQLLVLTDPCTKNKVKAKLRDLGSAETVTLLVLFL